MPQQSYQIGMIGLGVMGCNLALNIADKGFSVIGYDKNQQQVENLNQAKHPQALGVNTLNEFVESLQIPRAIIVLVPAGAPVDAVVRDLLPLLNPGDLIIDGGNSHYTDTNHRQLVLSDKGINFIGMGVSGGEAGARFGPCMMPGGPKEAYERVKPIIEAIAAHVDHEPCVAYLGPGSCGHYVKMVHNGIEYGLMQLISETYEILKNGLKFSDDELHEIYAKWNEGELKSFLMEITADIFLQVEETTGKRLIDLILGKAEQKGTGLWTSQDALQLHVPLPTIDIAVSMRDLSVLKYQWNIGQKGGLKGPYENYKGDRDQFVKQLERALYAGYILTFEQGMTLLRIASETYNYNLNLELIAKIWRGGCIIRSTLLEKIMSAYKNEPTLSTLLLDPEIAKDLSDLQSDLRSVVSAITPLGLTVPGLMASLSYYDAYRGSWLPTNLIQAQRDYFGAHSYERIDMQGTFHTDWSKR